MMEKSELYRQLFHLGCGILAVFVLYFDIFDLKFLAIVFGLGVVISIISALVDIPIISWFLRKFGRSKNKLPGKGALTLLLGVIITYYLFANVLGREDIALGAIMVLALADSIAPIVGRYFGRRPHPLNNIKLIEGTAAGIVAGALGAMIFVPPAEAILGSFFAMTLESVELKIGEHIVDDNLSVPIVAGFVFLVVGMLF